MPVHVVDHRALFEQCCAKLAASPRLALDTEFVRERTYYPRIGLIQAAVADDVFCVDPLAIDDLSPLLAIIEQNSRLKILHGARQDLEVLFQIGGTVPQPVFDTQIAAALLGFPEQIGYAALVEAVCAVTLDKGHTRTDWLRRPLSPSEIEYAAADVRHLPAIHDRLRERLEAVNRSGWVEEECKALACPALYQVEPAEAWRRVKGVAGLGGPCLGAVRHLARWREQTAQAEDAPRAWVLRDDCLVEIARRRPGSVAELAAIEGISPVFVRRHAEAVLDCLRAGADGAWALDAASGTRVLTAAGRRLARELLAFVRRRGAAAGVAASIIATRRDLEQAVAGDADARIFKGWRDAFVGSEIRARIAAADEGALVERA